MHDYLQFLQKNKQYKEVVHNLAAGKNCTVSGLWGSSSNFFIAALLNTRSKLTKIHPTILLIVPTPEEAEGDLEDLDTFIRNHTTLFPASENIFGSELDEESDMPAQRLSLLNQLMHYDAHTGSKLDIIVTPVQAL